MSLERVFINAGPFVFLLVFVFGMKYLVERSVRAGKIAGEKNAARYKEALEKAKGSYDLTLDLLSKSPESPTLRVDALDAGRKYYELAMPDTQTVEYSRQGAHVTSVQNNAAGREARISADIQARVGHLAIKKSA